MIEFRGYEKDISLGARSRWSRGTKVKIYKYIQMGFSYPILGEPEY